MTGTPYAVKDTTPLKELRGRIQTLEREIEKWTRDAAELRGDLATVEANIESVQRLRDHYLKVVELLETL